jgi:hypothetical protein
MTCTAHLMSRVRSGTGRLFCMIHAARSLISGAHGQRGRCRRGSCSPAAIASWLNVSAVPHPPPLDVPVQLTVTATDPVTNFPVAGDVNIDGARAGFTGQPFTYMFSDYASGWVKTASYITTPIDFGFPPPEVPS